MPSTQAPPRRADASVKDFFGGLEGFLGPPSAEAWRAMEHEHASTEGFEQTNSAAASTEITTPKWEWDYVAEGRGRGRRAGESGRGSR